MTRSHAPKNGCNHAVHAAPERNVGDAVPLVDQKGLEHGVPHNLARLVRREVDDHESDFTLSEGGNNREEGGPEGWRAAGPVGVGRVAACGHWRFGEVQDAEKRDSEDDSCHKEKRALERKAQAQAGLGEEAPAEYDPCPS
jgi:hypothetical protein